MRNSFIRVILFSMLAVFILPSCEDFLEPEQTDAIDPETAFSNISNAERTLLGVYSAYSSGGYIVNTARMADNLKIGAGNNGQGVFVHAWSYDAGDNLGWSTGYVTIFRANDVIFNIDGVPEATQEEINQIKGEALAMRAIAHFDLVRMYGARYQDGRDGVGIPYLDTENDITGEPSRNSVGEVFDKINADLDEAATLVTNTDDISRITPLAIEAIKARVALEMGDYPAAATHATNVINDPNAPAALATGTDYAQMFVIDAAGENIFSILNSGTFGQSFYASTIEQNYFEVNDDFEALFTGNDIRRTVNIGTRVPAQFNVEKYPGRTGSPDQFGANNIKYIRLSEMYLILAEANYRIDGSGLDELNAVRTARSADTGSESGEALLEAIITERRKELAFEADRWFTLKRLKRGVERMDCNSGNCSLSATDFRWLAPIPADEMQANPNMTQNPGY